MSGCCYVVSSDRVDSRDRKTVTAREIARLEISLHKRRRHRRSRVVPRRGEAVAVRSDVISYVRALARGVDDVRGDRKIDRATWSTK
jgi:hypothetical protein